MATYTERCGGGFPETASIEFKDERVELVMGNQEYGSGLVTSYKQVVSDQLGIDADRIDVIMGDTDRTPAGLTGGSRALAVAGTALYEAGAHDHRQGQGARRAPSGSLGAGRCLSPTGRSACPAPICASIFSQVAKAARDPAKLPAGMEPGLDTTHHARAAGADFSQRLPHRRSRDRSAIPARSRIARYTVVDDFGRTINPLLLEGQVHGGIVQGIGQALLEHAVYDPRERAAPVRLVHGLRHAARRRSSVFRFLDPQRAVRRPIRSASRARARPAPSARRRQSSTPSSTRCIVTTGVRHIDMPATPRRVWEAMNGRHDRVGGLTSVVRG